MKTIRSIWDKTVSEYGEQTAVKWLNGKEIKERTYGRLSENIKSVRTDRNKLCHVDRGLSWNSYRREYRSSFRRSPS